MIPNTCSQYEIELLANSGWFDRGWYLQRYPDVAMLDIDPALHYLWLGAKLRRDPSPRFCTRAYLTLNADVEQFGANPLLHYIASGQYESRMIAPVDDDSRWTRMLMRYHKAELSHRHLEFGDDPQRTQSGRIGVVIHAFYPEILTQIVDICDDLPEQFTYYVSTVPEQKDVVERIMATQQRPFKIIARPNRGRDVLPLLKVMEIMLADGVEFFAKVHTKRSLHRTDGVVWRNELYDAIIGRETFCRAIEAMRGNPRIGLLGPDGHFVSMRAYLGANFTGVTRCAEAFKADPTSIFELGFFAGTMFIARLDALKPILMLGFADDDFEEEAGQIDGTLAHVIERILTICIMSGGYTLASTLHPSVSPQVNSCYGFV